MLTIRQLRAPVSFFTPEAALIGAPVPPPEPESWPPLRLVAPPPAPRELIALVATAFRLTPGDITGVCRSTDCVLARSTVARILHDRNRAGRPSIYSMTRIGRYLGGRDHSTISHALGTFDRRFKENRRALAIYNRLRETLP